MALSQALANLASNASQSAGGSTNGSISSAQNYGYNVSDSGSRSVSDSWSYGATYGSEATAKSYAEALRAHARQQDFYNQAMAYNAEQAEMQRYFNKLMADTTYQRSVEDMKKAGINPILAASFGLSADSVNSGAAASVTSPSTFMGQTFADQRSASQSHSESNSWSHGQGESSGSSIGKSWGESWQNSTSGLSTFLDQMELTFDGLQGIINSGQALALGMDGIEGTTGKELAEKAGKTINNFIDNMTGNHGIEFSDNIFELISKLWNGKK